MSNMSYCRFENTLSDLQDCYENIDKCLIDNLSLPEKLARRSLIKLCAVIVEENPLDEE